MSILFGIIIFAQPMTGIATLMWIAGTFAILVGILMIFLSLKLRRSGDLIERRIKDFKSDPLT
jgi:uncharacterized membrane protein HdeD (DUF308 family)